ncbi:MAG: 30S ribosomal protein S12 methylthiotransferase RimO [Planctomycetota bacterium]|jgi:ribosomal protein S12 methylthiotransferase|nr:30S ribosomal protein S12 methylthiotransferase RimO [Planctomycetota bacterium]MDP6941969.1 30S ribosomal protein S12 methylthiotransferase RimO [Planctomycetota bacterium]
MASQDIRVALVHLGCARNLIDSEKILGRLGADGFALTGVVEDADVAVLNTCSFIGDARDESEGAIRDLLAQKESGSLRGVVVAGCLPQKFRPEIEERFPEVDAFLGLSDYSNVARVVESVLKGRKVREGDGGRPMMGASGEDSVRLLQTPRSYAYFRPSHGCDHECAFCIIPDIRGRQRSKAIDAVLEEANQLAESGVKELVLVAEDSTGYGSDFGAGGPRLPDLVETLAQVGGLEWIRVMYAYPNAFPWRLTEVMNQSPKVIPYLDIPTQHFSTAVLKKMKRGGTHESIRKILERLRAEVQGITLRTTVLVGHPGEGEKEFEELMAFLNEFRFERLGAFAFSPEAGTPAGDDMNRCSTEEAHERLAAVMELQSEIHASHQEARIGTNFDVLIDHREGPFAVGRSHADAPEVDGLVRVRDTQGELQVGDILQVRATEADGYDLLAETVEPSNPVVLSSTH